jgi:sugar O-acyltransferase (sialic acid O-acetyltransferase NeuD family)
MSGAKRDLLILGASGFGREVLWVIDDIPEASRGWRVAGFLDDDVPRARRSLDMMGVALPVLGTIRDHQPRSDELFVSAIGMSRPKLAVCGEMKRRGAQFANLIHPSARLHPTVVTGDGLFMSPLSGFSPGCVVGDFVALSASAGAGHDVTIGDGCFLGARCDVMGGATLGRGVFLGSHATIHPGVRVGDFVTVGIGSVLLRSTPADVSLFGVPARELAI